MGARALPDRWLRAAVRWEAAQEAAREQDPRVLRAAAQPAPARRPRPAQRSGTVVALADVRREVVPLALSRLPAAEERRAPQADPVAEEAG